MVDLRAILSFHRWLDSKKKKASILRIIPDQCLFGPAEVRLVQDWDSKKVWSAKRYAIGGIS